MIMKRKPFKEALTVNRLVFYLMILGLIPFFFVMQDYSVIIRKLIGTKMRLESVERLSLTNKKKQASNESVRKIFTNADHYYIDHHLETLVFLQKEKEDLEKILSSNAFPGDEKILER